VMRDAQLTTIDIIHFLLVAFTFLKTQEA